MLWVPAGPVLAGVTLALTLPFRGKRVQGTMGEALLPPKYALGCWGPAENMSWNLWVPVEWGMETGATSSWSNKDQAWPEADLGWGVLGRWGHFPGPHLSQGGERQLGHEGTLGTVGRSTYHPG